MDDPDTDSLLPKEFALDFITRYRSGALATIDSFGKPSMTFVYCSVAPDLSIYFSTRVEGRKFMNITENPSIAMAFQNEKDVQMLQLTGTAERVNDLNVEQQVLLELMKRRYHDANWPPPPLKLFTRGSSSEIAIIKITPLEMTYANFKSPQIGKYSPFFHKII